MLQLSLDAPRGISRQYFDAMITRGNGQTQKVQLSEQGLSLPFARADPPTAVRLVLQMFRVASEPVKLDPSSGYAVQFRFEPNDIGKVVLADTWSDRRCWLFEPLWLSPVVMPP